jgi:hypothetical protein
MLTPTVAAPCRKPCRVIGGSPARSASLSNLVLIQADRSEVPFSRVNTRPESVHSAPQGQALGELGLLPGFQRLGPPERGCSSRGTLSPSGRTLAADGASRPVQAARSTASTSGRQGAVSVRGAS